MKGFYTTSVKSRVNPLDFIFGLIILYSNKGATYGEVACRYQQPVNYCRVHALQKFLPALHQLSAIRHPNYSERILDLQQKGR